MKKVLLLSGISYLLLVSCGTSVSLTDNYFEDENYYDPTLPLPLFALPNNGPALEELGEDDLDAIWQGTTANGYNFPNTPTYTRNYWTTGFGRINSPYWSINSMGSWNTFGWNSPMGLSPWGNFWMPMGYNSLGMGGFGYDPYGYNPNSYTPYGYNPYGYNPYMYGYGYGYGYNPYGWNNGWASSGNSNNNTPTRPGINYGGSRPSKYGRSGGGSSINGRTTVDTDQSIGARTLRAIEQLSEPTTPKANSSRPTTRTRPTQSTYERPTNTQSYDRSVNERSWSQPSQSTRSSDNSSRSYSPSNSSGRSSSGSSGAGGSRRR